MRLEKDGILIRNAGAADAGQLAAWWNDGKVMAHAGYPNGLGTTEETVKKQLEAERDETTRRHIILYRDRPIGEMNYRNLGDKKCIMGIKICETDMQNKGFGKKILSLFIQGLFDVLGYELVTLDTNLENRRAQHVYEQLGFRKVMVHMNEWKDQLGREQSSVDYELTREDFRSFI
ncbi:MAG: GNAT family N-acetyltransferase [Clostridia bacterium]|nr:GNAT family N-acetyltransferase [Clostridia bacterium]